jgi:hypothetical protein
LQQFKWRVILHEKIIRKENIKVRSKQGVIRQRLMQEEVMSGMLFWSIGSGVIRKGVMLMRSSIYFEKW